MAARRKLHHYVESGLDNVYLEGGFKIVESPYGKGVAITGLDGLHRCIAECLIVKPGPLSGAEFRFLRKELDLSQDAMGMLCGRNARTVREWEKSEKVEEPANTIIRVIYKERDDKSATFEDMARMIAEIQKLDKQLFEMKLMATDGGWKDCSGNFRAA